MPVEFPCANTTKCSCLGEVSMLKAAGLDVLLLCLEAASAPFWRWILAQQHSAGISAAHKHPLLMGICFLLPLGVNKMDPCALCTQWLPSLYPTDGTAPVQLHHSTAHSATDYLNWVFGYQFHLFFPRDLLQPHIFLIKSSRAYQSART